MPEEIGRRAANKRATTAAIEQAAAALFEAQGNEATSVREIAAAAGVGERTFYRYFDGKEGLLADEVQHWIDMLQKAIRDRPGDEPPLTAVRRALATIGRTLGRRDSESPSWLLTNRPRPFELLQKSEPRPLLRFEEAITDALEARIAASVDADGRYLIELIARVSVSVIRAAAIRRRELQAADPSLAPPLHHMLDQAFALLRVVALDDEETAQTE